MRWLVLVLGFVVGGGAGWALFAPRANVESPSELEQELLAVVEAELAGAPAEPLDAIEVVHPPDVAAAMGIWVETGRAPRAAAALRKAGAQELASALEAIEQLRRACHGALLAGDVDTAAARFEEALSRERRLLPAGVASLPAAEMRTSLADALHERALLHEARDQAADAFAGWERAVAFDPTHVDSLAGLQRLELQAARALAAAPDCAGLVRVRATTRRESARFARCRPMAQARYQSAIRRNE